MIVHVCLQVKSVGQVLFNDVVQKLGMLESDYFDLQYTDANGAHVSVDQCNFHYEN